MASLILDVGRSLRSARVVSRISGLAPGDLARMAAAIIDTVDQEPPPLRVMLGAQALQTTLRS